MKYILALSLLLFINIKSGAQEKIPYLDIDDIYEELLTGSEPSDYEKNIELLDKISENDSAYCNVLISKSYYQINLEQYYEAIKTIDKGLRLDCGTSSLSLYINKGLSYSYLEDYNQAITVYKKALEIYPKNAELWSNIGAAYEKNENLKDAIKAYQTAITLNPTYAKPHLQLGNVCYKQERITQALMCYNVYLILIISEDNPNALNILQSINTTVTDKNENEANPDLEISPDDEAFDELDLIITNKIALNKKYKTGHKIEIPLTNQNHALLEQIKGFEGNGGFWDQKYVPLYQWIAENDLFENFTYTLCYPIENEKYAKIIKSNENGIIEFVSLFYEKWPSIMRNNIMEFDGKRQEITNYYLNGNTRGVGKLDGENLVGPWFFYTEEGQLASKGHYDANGEKDQKWTWYYPNGTIKETATYQNTKLEGTNHKYFENGRTNVIATYKNGELNGEYLIYNDKGALLEKKYFKADQLEGPYQSFFKVGDPLLEWSIPYEGDEIAATAIEYYANGDVYNKIPFKNGKRDGVDKKFYFNKNIASEIHYANGELNGAYKTYHLNGNIKEEGNSEDNYYNGSFKTYYENGTLESDETYVKGSLDGENKYYDTDGKIHSEFLYRNGEIIAYKYFNKTGHVIKEARKKGGEFQFTGYSVQGNKSSEGLYDIKGGKEGLWQFYSKNGVLTSKGTYSEDNAFGEYTTYHNNGEIESVSQYKNDSLNGYYTNYYKNGQLKQQGWYKNNKQHGEWRDYYINGTLKEINFHHNGQLHGTQKLFSVDGKPESTYMYKFGERITKVYFDQNNDTIGEINYNPKENNFKVTYKFVNGKTNVELDYVNGVKHGSYIRFDFYGNKVVEGNYKNDDMDGEWVWYYPNGTKSRVKHYRDGILNGDYIDYYENGTLEGIDVYVYGDREGTSKEFHENGVQSHSTDFLHGQLHGRKVFYDNSGKIQLIRFYNYGTLIGYSYLDTNSNELPMIPLENETGKIKAFFDNGKISRELEFKNGDLVGTYNEYYYSGQLESTITYKADEFDGVLTTYYNNGNKKSRFNYQYGVLQGLGSKYYENGNLKEEVNYVNDSKSGQSKYYNSDGKLTKEVFYFNDDIYKSQSF